MAEARFLDQDGVVRLAGDLETPSFSPAEGFGTAASVTVPTGVLTNLPLSSYYGDPLLDYTDPLNPTIIEAGIYAAFVGVSFNVVVNDVTKTMYAILDLDNNNFGSLSKQTAPCSAPVAGLGPQVSPALTASAVAGGSFKVQIAHDLGMDEDIDAFGLLQRLA